MNDRLKRVDYATDDDFFADLLKHEAAWAKKQRERIPYGIDFKPRLTMIGPDFQSARLPFAWDSNEERSNVLGKMAYIAKATGAQGIMTTTDTRMTLSDEFIKHFKLPDYKAMGYEKFSEDYHRILDEHGGQMKNLPRNCWGEAIVIGLKRPYVKDVGEIYPYQEGPQRSIEWIEHATMKPDGVEMSMIRKWWEIPDTDPLVAKVTAMVVARLEEVLLDEPAPIVRSYSAGSKPVIN